MTLATTSARGRRVKVEEIALLWTLLAALPAAGFDLSREACAIGVGALVVVPLLLSWLMTRRLLVGEPIIVLGSVWILAVTLPVLQPDLFKDRMWYTISPYWIDQATVWLYRSWAVCCLGYWLTRVMLGTRRPKIPSHFDLRVQLQMRRAIGVLGALGCASYYAYSGGQTYQFIEETATGDSSTKQLTLLLYTMSFAYIYLYFSLARTATMTRLDDYLVIVVLGLHAVLFIGSGTKQGILAVGAAYILGSAASRAKTNVIREAAIVVGSLGAIVLISFVVAAYREELLSRTLPPIGAPMLDVLAFQWDSFAAAIAGLLNGKAITGRIYTDYSSYTMIERFAHITSFALVLETAHGVSPQENAFMSFLAPLTTLIPRALWPDKVIFMDSGHFANLQGWTHGGLSLTTPGSFFWAWDYTGIIVGMTLTGVILAWIRTRGDGEHSNNFIAQLILVFLVIDLLDVGITFHHVYMGMSRVIVALLLIRWAIRVVLRGENRAATR